MNATVSWLKGLGDHFRTDAQARSDSRHLSEPADAADEGFLATPFWNVPSALALGLVVAALTLGAAGAFPLWDDAWNWLYFKERGSDFVTAIPDRPLMAYLWTALASSEEWFWRINLALHAITWFTYGVTAALLWRRLFPETSGYGWVVACLTVAPFGFNVQLMLANIVLGSLLGVVLAYTACLLLLRYITEDHGSGDWKYLAVSQVMLACSILLIQYALAVLVVMVVLTVFPLGGSAANDARSKRRYAVLSSLLVGGLAYGGYYLLAEWSKNTEVIYAHPPIAAQISLRGVVNGLQALWQGLIGNIALTLGGVHLTTKADVGSIVYGLLVGGLLTLGLRPARISNRSSPPSGWALLVVGLALVATLALPIYSGRLPWDPDDGITARFGLASLPLIAIVLVGGLLHLTQPRLWAVPVAFLGLAAGQAAFSESWHFAQEKAEMAQLGPALQPYLSKGDGLTVAVISTPARKFGPPRQWELTARIASSWPEAMRERFWAVRYGGNPPLTLYVDDAGLIFGARGKCMAPNVVDFGTRLIKRTGKLDRLLWVERLPNGEISVEPYCSNLSNNERR
jgi:hypothetical protein